MARCEFYVKNFSKNHMVKPAWLSHSCDFVKNIYYYRIEIKNLLYIKRVENGFHTWFFTS